ncbi:MAG: DUF393 domain-containing protein [Okeania sp. SIO1H5]|uniref:thiol-disulfide oxidoreductase DCC family protein n=1 Tax=Okeania sp. SIO1H5 TaxID=2607777 RepID=UPI0013BB219F|nr:DCC1-like thiol-disulfide oxidoreductase family protein [Okeania sp. SIO1H5]NET23846.1 DUF393 domain-containing protein [Okeania sp. SIO1H5]
MTQANVSAHPAHQAKLDGGDHPIIFFDGVCGLCNGFVDFCMARDKWGLFRYATLQGETALQLLGPLRGQNEVPSDAPSSQQLQSVVLFYRGETDYRSEAVLKVLQTLGGIFVLTKPLRLLPLSFRDWVYALVARNRFRWFGKKPTCRIPTELDRKKFLP